LKVLQICHKMPYPPSDGGAQAIHTTTIGLLKNKIDVNVLAINPSRNYIDVSSLPTDYTEATNFMSVYVNTDIRLVSLLLNFFSKDSYFIQRFKSIEFEKVLIEVLSKNSYDIIQLEHLYIFLYLDAIKKHSTAKLVFRPQNIEYVIWERYLRNINNPLKKLFIKIATKRLKKFEKSKSGEVDGIIALTKDDAEILRKFVRNKPVVDIPMGFDFGDLENYDFNEQYIDFPVFYHLGSMDWLPNEEALRWFVDEILHLVITKMPDVKIHIAGRNMQNYFYQIQSKNLVVEGEKKNPIEFQKNKAVMIVPLLSGSGIRAKIVEGIALGKTIITTTIGAQGIKYTDGENLLIADTPEKFAEQMYKCYLSEDFCKTISNNARKLSNENYHYISIAKEMIHFYTKLIRNEI
jgi:polysaccharide biosynthesis protein PslH